MQIKNLLGGGGHLLGTSGAVLALLVGLMLFVPTNSRLEASATEDNSGAPITSTTERESAPGIATLADTSAGISVPSSIDFTDVVPTDAGATTTATASVGVTTTNSSGYSLYLYTTGDDNSLKPSNPANSSSISATNTTSTLNNLTNNTWGYNLGTTTPTTTTTYSAVPTSNSTPIQTKDTSTTNSANDTYTLSFAAKVNTDLPSGDYSNTLTLALVANPAMITIAFNGNGATGGSMANIEISAGGSQALPNNTFTRTNYNFTGWNTSVNGNGTSYSNGATLTTTTGQAGETITLYAQWERVFGKDTMQGFTVADCQAQASTGNVTLEDARDGNTYTVRYINGACWMTQNLRLSSGRTLTQEDSNVTSSWSFPTDSLTSGNSYTEARSIISSNTYYGGYYNYCAASAGTACSQTEMDATQDICPKGWRLPTLDEMEGITNYTSALSPVYSGYYFNGSLYDTGDFGVWWSATALTSNLQYYLYYVRGILHTRGNDKSDGISVRCVRAS